ncbi:MAG: hypothetical protein A8274_1293 [Halanaerobium sp. 4-GBenrich]|uniref:Uncharacterized protein n=1 Tax=Halanaerobium congolense TaxID=54121 RepID=A0A318EB87_9FIRM|nr:hypothetical protein [Halanaerobium congolense]ODS49745.1 MAG: hypothetical protein A8274_1293 [Halanaerobium sp. 4-GBenrich]PXV67025.1 hypothetical protein C8C78_10975 [Halanaerobium congolense]
MSNNIDKSKLVYVNIVWMKYYRGLSEKDEISLETGGGSHPQEYLDAIETTMNSKSIPKDYNIFVAAENAYLIKENIMFLSPSKRFPKVFCSNLNYAS